MFKLFRKTNEIIVKAPCCGKVIPLEDVKDTMFSQKMLGDGFAIIPSDDTICSPCDGKVVMLANTGHAFGIECDNGVELLVHVGLDTVNLQGKGFSALAKVNQKVKAGKPILRLDLDYMKTQQVDLTIPVIITNGNDYHLKIMIKNGEVTSAHDIMSVEKR